MASHTHDDLEGHEHQYSDFLPAIRKKNKVEQEIEKKIDLITYKGKHAADQLAEVIRQHKQSFLSKSMKIDVIIVSMNVSF